MAAIVLGLTAAVSAFAFFALMLAPVTLIAGCEVGAGLLPT
jgi:hypothetical protein